MTIMRLGSALTVVLAIAIPASAQSILFENTLSNALRQRPANRVCTGCDERPGTLHLIVDSPLLADAWIAAHDYRGTSRGFDDGTVVADFWYDAVHRRVVSRSGVFHEVD